MQTLVLASFQNTLLGLAQSAVGCLILFLAIHLANKGFRLHVNSGAGKTLAILASSLAGMLLPLGAFGAIPVMAAGAIAGLELPLVLPVIVSGFIFNISIPLTEPVFIWNGNLVRILAALGAGILAGLLLYMRKADGQALVRESAWKHFFSDREKKKGYFIILRDYIEAAGLFIVAGAVLKAVFSTGLTYGMQNWFFSTGFGFSTISMLSTLNVFNPLFCAAVQILGRLLDFSYLAAFAMLLRPKYVITPYLYVIAISLVLSVGLFIRA